MVNRMKHILIIEDDVTLAEGLCRALSAQDIEANSCGTLQEARQRLQSAKQRSEQREDDSCCSFVGVDLILLDVNLPDGSGFDFLKEIREYCTIPVIMLTANDMESDMVYGLENGAVDYITKPFSLAVLRARVGAQLRQQEIQMEQALQQGDTSQGENVWKQDGGIIEGKKAPICIDDYCFDFERMEFRKADCVIELSKTEQKLLRIFIENRGITLKRSELVDRIWTDGAEYVDENALSVTVKRLRDKLSAAGYIKTVYGIGYVWEK